MPQQIAWRKQGPNTPRKQVEIDLPAKESMFPRMELQELNAHLTRRREIIADHAWRERDSAGQLQALQDVSEAIAAWHHENHSQLPAKLDHFLKSCSFDKAQAFVQASLSNTQE